jgi:GT2 family glycosyltransferase
VIGEHENVAAPDVSIIVVSYNSEDYLEHSLEAVSRGAHEVIVVDNASTDRSTDIVRSRFPSVRILEMDHNVGFGAACNAGMSLASGRYLLVMNPDAWPEPDAIAELVHFADRHPHAGAVGPRLRSQDGRIQRSHFGFPTALWLGTPAVTSSSPDSSWITAAFIDLGRKLKRLDKSGRKAFVVGAALMLRREAVAGVGGGFDPDFFMFNEDVDLCWRLLEAGWAVELCKTAHFIHVGGGSTRDRWPAMYREQLRGHLLFLARHRGKHHAALARHVLLFTSRVRAALHGDSRGAPFREAAAWLAATPADQLSRSGGREHT